MNGTLARCRLLLADDHDIVLAGLRIVLDDPALEIVGSANDGRSLVRRTDELQPDMIVTDVSMPLLNGIDAARQIRKLHPRIRIVFLSMHSELEYAVEAMALGGCAYVLKSSVAQELPEAIKCVLAGQTYIARAIDEPVRRALAARSVRRPDTTKLTPRQREVLQLLAEGRSTKEIASSLCVSPRTIEFHKYRIMEEIGVHSIAELARYAAQSGLVA